MKRMLLISLLVLLTSCSIIKTIQKHQVLVSLIVLEKRQVPDFFNKPDLYLIRVSVSGVRKWYQLTSGYFNSIQVNDTILVTVKGYRIQPKSYSYRPP